MFSIISDSADKTAAVGKMLTKFLKAGDVVALSGELGAGKTMFTKGIAEALHASAEVQSPTFNIVREYEADIPLFHFDFYRIKEEDELFEIGYEEYLYKNGICIIEWADMFLQLIPKDAVFVNIGYTGDNARKISIARKGVF